MQHFTTVNFVEPTITCGANNYLGQLLYYLVYMSSVCTDAKWNFICICVTEKTNKGDKENSIYVQLFNFFSPLQVQKKMVKMFVVPEFGDSQFSLK